MTGRRHQCRLEMTNLQSQGEKRSSLEEVEVVTADAPPGVR